ncbi:50S ribosomal protein L22 [Candidatus Nomurabacteria bacterium RIFCSPLOWO2_01_FULL_36_10b]|uniref:Large ribosomal subunit protein uL22 n=1 Tax=Candidatus Nomurabacteria bacterium RIFCSPLOWO2_01_FULL_36_10b TaxID=1801766 RepID=A0A1F6WPD9_9BACT|nr:MAG: 50S ribosomal protein L22 [Candidatus Nomurabacteria bacterium RIFCSPLOWO2_01_FULL_36_10b]
MKAFLKNYRQQPRKVRLVADTIRGKSVTRALSELPFLPKHAASAIKKLLDSAVQNAEHNFKVTKENLYVKEISVNKGITLRRSMPMSRGRAFPIHKRTSRIEIILGQK